MADLERVKNSLCDALREKNPTILGTNEELV